MKPTIHTIAMLRIPQFSIAAKLYDNWEALKVSICHSSPNFYHYIKDVSAEELKELPPAIAMTVWKYFNRAKYRPVPYGHFAGVALVPVQDQAETSICISDQLVHRFVNWEEQVKSNIADIRIDFHQQYLFANTSHYQIHNRIRYISFFDEQYQLSEIDSNPVVHEILEICSQPFSYAGLIEALKAHGCRRTEAQHIIASLISLQLLIKSSQPNIIGKDYFKRSGIIPVSQTDYLIAERPVLSGALSDHRFRQLPQLISLLAAKLPPQSVPEMADFARRFAARYGDREIPLMLALDPEYGIGYGGLELMNDTESLAVSLAAKSSSEEQSSGFREALLALLINRSNKRSSIDLEELLTGPGNQEAVLPNSISVLLSEGDWQIYAESIGGSTSIAMMARFSLASAEITEHCRAIAALESEANPDVVFFDIGYTAEKTIDNINRRESIYHAQLNILNYDTSEIPLSLNDLQISVQQDKVLMRSKRSNKRLVPRLCSAYNYSRSDLSLFRFLCDLQYQGLQVDLTLDLQRMLPGFDHYPELRFKNIVLSPARWKVSANQALHTLQLPRYFLMGSGDQTLCFDQQNPEDMQLFSRCLQKEKHTYIREAFIKPDSNLRDEKDQPYHAQVLLSMVHREQIYHPLEMQLTVPALDTSPQLIPPGGEWVYFEVYCQPHTANSILTGPIAELLHEHAGSIEKWFFIRYTENGPHLRLRLQLKDALAGQQIISAFAGLLRADLEHGRVSDLSLNTYRRETQRYIGNDIRDIEQHFYLDSHYVLSILALDLSDFQKYRLCEQLIASIAFANVFSSDQFSKLLGELALAYKSEHKINNGDFKKINAAYKHYAQSSEALDFTASQQKAFDQFTGSFLNTLLSCKTELRENLFSDLLHMHFNRLFATSQRAHELIFYNFLIKGLVKSRIGEAIKPLLFD